MQYLRNPTVAEALVARQAVLLAKDLGFERVVFEGDCLSIITALQNNLPVYSSFGPILILDDLRTHLSSFSYFSFSYVNRLSNTTAHELVQHVVEDGDSGMLLSV